MLIDTICTCAALDVQHSASWQSCVVILHHCQDDVMVLYNSSAFELVSWLAGALSPVNHKGILQGGAQTSFYFLVIHFTSHDTTSHAFF